MDLQPPCKWHFDVLHGKATGSGTNETHTFTPPWSHVGIVNQGTYLPYVSNDISFATTYGNVRLSSCLCQFGKAVLRRVPKGHLETNFLALENPYHKLVIH